MSGEGARVMVSFSASSWRMLTQLAEAEGVEPGAMLGIAIARAWHLQSVKGQGGQIYVRRGRRYSRLIDGERSLEATK